MNSASCNLRIHSLLTASRVNGPGLRAVIWMQGCTFHCPGCFNAASHAKEAGKEYSPAELESWIFAAHDWNTLDGITISGGEPLQQWAALLPVLQWFKATYPQKTIVLFTGYNWNELGWKVRGQLEQVCDVVISGRYEQEKRVANHLVGSSNKEFFIFSDAYKRADFEAIPVSEIHISADGTISITGINPVRVEA